MPFSPLPEWQELIKYKAGEELAMYGIYWMGAPNPFFPDIQNSNSIINSDLLVCLSSECEVETAINCEQYNKLGLSVSALLHCTNRLSFRMALAGLELNTWFSPVNISPPAVLKMSASTSNTGVYFINQDTYTGVQYNMDQIFPDLKHICVVEEMLTGTHYEISGFILKDKVYFRLPYQQRWNQYKNKILEYTPADINIYPLDKLRLALKRLGLNNTFFNMELVLTADNQWKLIEVQPRLGEDVRLNRERLYELIQEFCDVYIEET